MHLVPMTNFLCIIDRFIFRDTLRFIPDIFNMPYLPSNTIAFWMNLTTAFFYFSLPSFMIFLPCLLSLHMLWTTQYIFIFILNYFVPKWLIWEKRILYLTTYFFKVYIMKAGQMNLKDKRDWEKMFATSNIGKELVQIIEE